MSLDKIRGMMIAGAVGDALCAPHEMSYNRDVPYTGRIEHRTRLLFQYHGTVTLQLAQITDDSELALTLARSIISYGGYNRDATTLAYMQWATSGSPMMGSNTRALLHGIKTLAGYRKRYEKAFNVPISEYGQSNGSLMRCASLAVLFDNTAVLEDCTITNPHPVNQDASQVYIGAIRLALQEQDPPFIFTTVRAMAQTPEVRAVFDQVARREARNLAEYIGNETTGTGPGLRRRTNKGWVLHGLYCALWSLLYFNRLQDALDWVIAGHPGSDTDTNAAITGNLLGARLGYDALMTETNTGFNIPLVRNCDTTQGDLPRPQEYTLHDFDALTSSLNDIYVSQFLQQTEPPGFFEPESE